MSDHANSSAAGNSSCVQTQEEVQATQVINAFVPLFLVVVGNVFNILAILVMRTKHFRFLSTSVYMIAGAINDASSLVVALIPHWLNANYAWTIVRTPTSFPMCGFFNFYGWSNCDFGIVVTAAMTADRAYAIFDPLKSTSRDLRKRAHKALVILAVLVVSKNFHFWFVSDIVPLGQSERLCVVNSSSETYTYFYNHVWPFLHIAFLTICFVVIIVSNAIIIHHVRQSAQGRFSRKARQASTGKALQGKDSSQAAGHENGGFTSTIAAGEVTDCGASNNGQAVGVSFVQRQSKTRRGILSRMKGKRSNLFRIRFSSLDHNANQSPRRGAGRQGRGQAERPTESSDRSSSSRPSPVHGATQGAQNRGGEGQDASRRRTTPRTVKIGRRGSRSSEKWRQITVMLLADSFTLVLLTYPFSFFLAVSLTAQPPVTCSEQSLAALLFSVTFYLLYSNKCVNFCLYCITGSRFRQALREVLRGCCGRNSLPASSRLSWLSSRRLVEKNGPLSGENNSSDDPHCASISAAAEGCQELQAQQMQAQAPQAQQLQAQQLQTQTPQAQQLQAQQLQTQQLQAQQLQAAVPSSSQRQAGRAAADPCAKVWTSTGSGRGVLETCFGAGHPHRRRHYWPRTPQHHGLASSKRSRSFLPRPVVDRTTVEVADLKDSGFQGDSCPGSGHAVSGGDSDSKGQADALPVFVGSEMCSVREANNSTHGVHDDLQSTLRADAHAVYTTAVFCVCQGPVFGGEQSVTCHGLHEDYAGATGDDTVEIFV